MSNEEQEIRKIVGSMMDPMLQTLTLMMERLDKLEAIECKREISIPRILEKPDFRKLKSMCQEHIYLYVSGTISEDDDSGHYIYEEVLKTLYGEKIFDWINKKIKRINENTNWHR